MIARDHNDSIMIVYPRSQAPLPSIFCTLDAKNAGQWSLGTRLMIVCMMCITPLTKGLLTVSDQGGSSLFIHICYCVQGCHDVK